MRIRFVAEARAELYSVARHYETQAPGLGERFLIETETTLGYIKQYPLARPPLVGAARRWRLSRFPHALRYALQDDVIYVLAVGHLRRKPDFWKVRSRRRRL